MIRVEFTARSNFAMADLAAIVHLANGTIQFTPRVRDPDYETAVTIEMPSKGMEGLGKWLETNAELVTV